MRSTYNALEYNKLVSFIWSVADECLRDHYNRGKYRDVIIPMTVIRRLDLIIEPRKQEILDLKKMFERNGADDMDKALNLALDMPFYNISKFSLKDLRSETNKQNLKKNFEDYLNGYSDNVKEILSKFKFFNQLDTMTEAGILGSVIEKFTSSELNLSPYHEKNSSGEIIKQGLDNHAMGTLFEELIRKFNEENNEEAGEHFTPRDVVELMADIALLPIMDKIKNGTYTIYDGACGTLGMGTVAAERFEELAKENGKRVSIYLSGQEVNPETYAIAKADMLIKGENLDVNEVYFGSTLSNDKAYDKHFDFMLSNPPYGKNWKTDLSILGSGASKNAKDNIIDKRFVCNYNGESKFSMIPAVSDGQIMFLLNNVSKMKDSELGSRIVEVHNGSSLFTGDAGSGESNARRYMIENDLIEAIIQLPENMFYNTGISTYIWILSNHKDDARKGKIQLIDASKYKTNLRKNMGKKNCELSLEDKNEILKLYIENKECENSKIFSNDDFGFYKITVDRPLKLAILNNAENIVKLEVMLSSILDENGKVDRSKIDSSFLKSSKAVINEIESSDKIAAYIEILKVLESEDIYLDYLKFEKEFNKKAKDYNIKGLSFKKLSGTGLLDSFIIKNENAKEVINSKGEIKSDSELRDTEIVPFNYDGGIEMFMKNEVLPYHKDAYINEQHTKIGYEINFTKHFYKPKELESVESIVAKIRELEKKSDGMLASILEGLYE